MTARFTVAIAATLLIVASCSAGEEAAEPPARAEPAQQQVSEQRTQPQQQVDDDEPEAVEDEPAAERGGEGAEAAADAGDVERAAGEAAGDEAGRVVFAEVLGGRGFEQPVELVAWPGGGLLVAEQRGSLTLYGVDGSTRGVMDLSDRVRFAGEQGLLSVALDPAFAERPFLYVWYSPRSGELTRLSRFRVDGEVAERDSELVILEVAQPYANHNGGAVRFGPDGMLYLGIGDGGGRQRPTRPRSTPADAARHDHPHRRQRGHGRVPLPRACR